MNRLIAFGCSHTWGDYLTEDHNREINRDAPPHKESWPYVLGEILQRDVINISFVSESNKAISHKIFNFNFQSTDVVVPLWTHLGRHCVIQKINESHPYNYIRHNVQHIKRSRNKLTERYYRGFYSLDDEYFQTVSYIQSVNFSLQSKVARVLNCFASQELIDFFYSYNIPIPLFKIPFYQGYSRYGKALDKQHLSREANRKFAVDLSRYLTADPLTLF